MLSEASPSGTPTSTAVPPRVFVMSPGRTASAIWCIVISLPMQSKANSRPLVG